MIERMRAYAPIAWLPGVGYCCTQHAEMDMYLDFYQLKSAPFQNTP